MEGPFDQRVWVTVSRIPHGRLATYGQIADLIGAYGCARQVGWALRRLKLPTEVPVSYTHLTLPTICSV